MKESISKGMCQLSQATVPANINCSNKFHHSIVNSILALNPDVVVVDKPASRLAIDLFAKANVAVVSTNLIWLP